MARTVKVLALRETLRLLFRYFEKRLSPYPDAEPTLAEVLMGQTRAVDAIHGSVVPANLRLAEAENLGDWGPIQGGLSEMRIHFGPGYRLYFARRGSVLIVLLNGGTKSTQARDIKRANRLLQELELDS